MLEAQTKNSLNLQFHPLADIFPLMNVKDLQALEENIKQFGLLEPITLFEGKILDGRNRYLACKSLGVQLRTMPFDDTIEPLDFVISIHLRRDLTIWQKIEVAEKLVPIEEEKAKQRMLLGKADPTQDLGEGGEVLDIVAKKLRIGSGELLRQGLYALHYAPPEELEKVKREDKAVTDFYRELKRWETLEEQKEKIKGLSAPEGKYDVIVIDPAWPYGTKYDPQGRRVASPYPEMTIEELEKLQLPVWDHCILWLWTTNAFIHDALHLIAKWSFEQKTILTWGKDKIGLGDWLRGQTEHCILAVKGKPRINLTNQSTLLLAKNLGHSVKPDEFYALVDSLCHGRKLDYFARKRREGWDTYGTVD